MILQEMSECWVLILAFMEYGLIWYSIYAPSPSLKTELLLLKQLKAPLSHIFSVELINFPYTSNFVKRHVFSYVDTMLINISTFLSSDISLIGWTRLSYTCRYRKKFWECGSKSNFFIIYCYFITLNSRVIHITLVYIISLQITLHVGLKACIHLCGLTRSHTCMRSIEINYDTRTNVGRPCVAGWIWPHGLAVRHIFKKGFFLVYEKFKICFVLQKIN